MRKQLNIRGFFLIVAAILFLPLSSYADYYGEERHQLCEGTTLTIGTQVIRTAGVYTQTLKSLRDGSDSIVQHIVSYMPTYRYEEHADLLYGESVEWHGQHVDGSQAVYYDRHSSVSGCDSLYVLTINRVAANPLFIITDTVHVCTSQLPYVWQGTKYEVGGHYYRVFKTVAGADSIRALQLIVDRPKTSVETYTMCSEGMITLSNNRVITKPGIYRDTLFSVSGCDSIRIAVVNAAKSYRFEESTTLKQGQTINWQGLTIKAQDARDYFAQYEAVSGCDSIYVLHLKVVYDRLEGYLIEEKAQICEQDRPYRWRGRDCFQQGTYFDSLRTKDGLRDSVYCLHLTVDEPYHIPVQLFLCEGGEVEFAGQRFSQPGVYSDTLLSLAGCDSIIDYQVKLVPSYYFREAISISDQQSYSWHGQLITQTGTYYDSHKTAHGCDSIYELTATVLPSYFMRTDTTVCASELPFVWRGREYAQEGVYTDPFTTKEGRDSIYVLDLKVNPVAHAYQHVFICHGGEVTINGITYAETGIFEQHLKTSRACDSLVTVVVNYYPTYVFSDTVIVGDNELPYLWRGHSYTTSGIYTDNLKTTHGCDSIYSLRLIVASSFLQEESATVCQSELPYIWRGQICNESKTYEEAYTSIYGKDSIYRFTLTVLPVKRRIENLQICDGSSVSINGRVFTNSAQFNDTLRSAQGCDSIVSYVITKLPNYSFTETLILTDQQLPYSWHGQQITASGTYTDDHISINGCDSSYTVTVTVYPTFHFDTTVVVCPSELPIIWQCKPYTQSGTYEVREQTVDGYDSIYTLHLTVLQPQEVYRNISICEGGSFQLRGQHYTESGVVDDTIRSYLGCDSIVHYVINKYPIYHFTDSLVISSTQVPYFWRGQLINTSGNYTQTLTSVAGCDSIYEINIQVKDAYLIIQDTTVCESELPFTWHGKQYTQSGTYSELYHSVDNQDSIYQLNLTVYPIYRKNFVLSLCQGGSVTCNGRTFSETGVYTDTFPTIHGCDSIITYVVKSSQGYLISDTLQISDRETRIWHGQTISAAGTYRDVKTSASGCDSIYELVVRVYPTYLFDTAVIICQTEAPFLWRGQSYNRLGTNVYTERYNTVQGYDSIYRLTLTINPVYTYHRNISICEGDSVIFRDHVFKTEETVIDTLLSSTGCDSIEIIHVHVSHAFLVEEHVSLNDGAAYFWPRNGQTYTKAGTYEKLAKTVAGCDSIYRLTITRNPSYLFVTDTTICQTETPFLWRGRPYNKSGVYRDTLHTIAGQDSIYQLNLTYHAMYRVNQDISICQGESHWYRGIEYTKSGTYTDTLQSIYGCDSILTVTVNVNPTFHVVDTLTICGDDEDIPTWHGQSLDHAGTYFDRQQTTNGCDSIYELLVIRHPEFRHVEDVIICQSEAPYEWRGRFFSELGEHNYFDHFVDVHGCDSVYQLHLTINPTRETHLQFQTCTGQSITYNGQAFAPATQAYELHFQTESGCDSVVWLHVNALAGYQINDTVRINEGQSYTWLRNGQTYTDQGVYELYEKTVGNCDSIMRLYLYVHKPVRLTETEEICLTEEQPFFEWHGKQYNTTGVYYDSIIGENSGRLALDTIYTLDLTAHPFSITYIEKDICQSETYTFNDIVFTESGTKEWRGYTQYGCDSIIRIHVNFSSYNVLNYDTICDGDTLLWRGQEITEEGFYNDRKHNLNNCDSIFKLNVIMLYNFNRDFADTICEDMLIHQQPYLFGPNKRPMWGQWNEETGHWEDSTYVNCAGNHYFTLHIVQRPITADTIHLCQGDSVWMPIHTGSGFWITKPGYYDDTIPSVREVETHGCDSIYRMQVYYYPNSVDTITKHLSDKRLPYTWKGQTITETGFYSDTLPMSHGGCDSITVLHLIVDTTYYFLDSVTICKPTYYGPGDSRNKPYLWEGHTKLGLTDYPIYNEGIYFDSLRTRKTKVDSIYELRVKFFPVKITKQTYDLCEGDSVRFGDAWIHHAGIYRDTMRSIDGCDSILQWSVNMLPSYFRTTTITIPDDETYTWRLVDLEGDHSRVLNATGIYRDTLKTARGCDSIVELRLTLMPTYHFFEKDTVCESQLPYSWVGHKDNKVIYKAGTYEDRYKTVAGYDSTYTLTLTVLPSYRTREVYTVCEGDSLHYLGHVYTEPGVYYDTLHSALFCDSIIAIDFQWRDKYLTHKSASTTDDNPYIWREGSIVKTLTHSGVYRDTLTSVRTGCDSIIVLNLTVYPTYNFDTTVTICRSETPFWWHGRTYSNTGVYYDSLQSVNHADSVYALHLQVLDTVHTSQLLNICEGETFTYNGRTYDCQGLYMDTLTRLNGCDSIIQVNVRILPKFFITQTATTTDKYPYTWHGKTLTSTGIYFDSLQSVSGCDSIYCLSLTVYPTYDFDTTVTICRSETPFWWHGRTYSNTGVYYDSLQSVNHADSVYALHLQVLDTVHTSQLLNICEGETFTYNGRTYDRQGLYMDTLTRLNGCDSIIQVNVRILPKYFITQTATTTDKSPYIWHGHTYTQSGVYFDSLQAVTGCDSIYQLTLTVYPTYDFDTTVTICRSETPFWWHGKTYSNTGVYYDSLQSVNHADSVYALHLQVLDTAHVNYNITLCEGETATYNGRTYDRQGLYMDTLTRLNGCDSIIHVNVRILPKYFITQTATTTDKSPYIWHGHTYTQSGVYFDSLQAVTGCDSIYQLTLTVYPTYDFDTTVTICRSETPFWWHGRTYSNTGVYYDSLQSVNHADSVYALHLQVLDTAHVNYNITLCEGETATYNGRIYDRQGIFMDTLSCANGCDSIIHVNVRILPKYFITQTATTTDKSPYIWHGHTYTQSGVYFDSLQAVTGCDSVYQLTLTVYPTYDFDTTVTICRSETPFWWHGKTYSNTGVYYDSLQSVNHADSVYALHLQVLDTAHVNYNITLCDGETSTYNGRTYDRQGIFMDTLSCANGCDSIIHVNVRILPKYFITQTATTTDKHPYIWHGHTYTQSGVYFDSLQAVTGCDSIYQLTLTVFPTYDFDTTVTICRSETPFWWHSKTYSNTGVYYDSLQSIHHADSVYALHLQVLDTAHVNYNITLCDGETSTYNGRTYDRQGIFMDTLSCANGCDSIIHVNVRILPKYFITQTATTTDKHPYTWHGHTYTQSGVYFDSLQAVTGCDSVYQLTLTVYPTYDFDTTVTICQSETPFWWHGKTYSNTGVYYDSLQSINHADSVYALHLQVLDTAHVNYNITLCEGDSAIYNGQTYRVQGIYHDTLSCTNGCDSIITIRVQVMPKYHFLESAETDDRTPFVWHCKTYTQSGVYYDKQKTTSGCDSIYELRLTVYPTYERFDSLTICQSELPYSWHNQTINSTGYYSDTLQTVAGYDSIFQFHLIVLPTYQSTVDISLCQGEVFSYNNKVYDVAGIYTDTLKSVSGCDSVITINFQHRPTFFFPESAKISDQGSYTWHGHTYTRSGVYYDSLQTVFGCDSVYQLTLSVFPTYQKDTIITICQSETPYVLFNRTYNNTGIYTDTLQTVAGYDSIYTINLTVMQTSYSELFVNLCQGDAFHFNGKSYTEPGLFTDTISAYNGCDSIVTIHINQRQVAVLREYATICESAAYSWHGRTLRNAGVYVDTLRSVISDCDSIYSELYLSVTPNYLIDTTVTICSTDLPYIFNNRSYTASGVYTDTLQTQAGCDSIINLHLTVYPLNIIRSDTTLCYGDIFVLNGRSIDIDGIYRDTVMGGMGCGTIYEYYVKFNRPQFIIVNAETSTNKPYIWRYGNQTRAVNFPGVYTDTVHSVANPCDSIIYQLNLTVYPTYEFMDSVRICSNELPYQWHGKSYWNDTVAYDSLQTINHYDSIYTLKLFVAPAFYAEQSIDLCEGAGPFYFRGKNYNKQGIYYDTIPSITGCDSILKIIVRVHPTYDRTDTVHISDQQTYTFDGRVLSIPGYYEMIGKTSNGCDSISRIWLEVHPSYYFNDSIGQCQGDTLYWHDQLITESGIYKDENLTKYGYDSIYTLKVVFHPKYYIYETYTVTTGHSTFVHGHDISKPGVYIDSLTSIFGCDSVYHIVVNSPRVFTQTFSYQMCQGEVYNFYGRQLTKSGSYKYTSPANDSVITINLTVFPTVSSVEEVVVDPSSVPYFHNGRFYDHTDNYYDTLKTVNGCDSLTCVKFTVTTHVSDWIPYYICPGSSVVIGNDTITKPGAYTFIMRRPNGMRDSLYRAEVFDAPEYDFPVENIAICQNELPYLYHGKLIRRGGLNDIVFKSIHGCDSVYHVNVTVWPSYEFLEGTTVIPDYESFYWPRTHKYYNQSDTLRDIYATAEHNCDSVYMYNLVVVPTQTELTNISICSNTSYTWKYKGQDSIVSQTGFYNDTIWNAASRTSVIRSLHLIVSSPTTLDSVFTPSTICADDPSFDIYFYTSQTVPDSYSLDFEAKANQQGLRDIVNQPLGMAGGIITVPMFSSRKPVYTDHDGVTHYQYIRPDRYKAVLTLNNDICGSSVDSFEIVVNYPDWIIEQKWDNVVAPLCRDSNGGYDFNDYQWYIYDKDGNLTARSANSYYYTGSGSKALPEDGYAILEAKRRGEDYMLQTCPMQFRTYIKVQGEVPHLAPNRVPRHAPVVTLTASESGTYRIYSLTGQTFAQGNFIADDQQLRLPAVAGCYMIEAVTATGQKVTEKIIVY